MNMTAIAAFSALVAVATTTAPGLDADDDPTSLGQPDFYGRLELGDDSPRPELYFSEPRLVDPVAEYEESIYLRVRPGESNEWALYCHQYEACARYVYFVNDEWYLAVYVPYYRDRNDRDDPTYDNGATDSVRRPRDERDERRNDQPSGEPGEVN